MSRRTQTLAATALCGLLAASIDAGESRAPVPATVDFDGSVAPILARRCLRCHNGRDRKGRLDLERREGAARGGKTGVAISPGDARGSLLWQRVAAGEMPPDARLPDDETALLERWIAAGAPWGTDPIDRARHAPRGPGAGSGWAFRPLARPRLPDIPGAWSRDPVDVFVAVQHAVTGLAASPEADRRVLARRLAFDLTGLPPAPEEIVAFVADDAPDAVERLVDRLLASPRLGERWARHWLDVVRFTESQGFEYDRLRPNAWHYRDYVIDAFNSDLPYDRFVREQIAGDAMDSVTPAGIVATSILVCGPWDQAGSGQANLTQRAITREEEMEDLVATVSQTFLGLTVNCARCHDHKFDPIPQLDYYRFKAAFDGVRHGERPIVPPDELASRERERAALAAEIAAIDADIERLDHDARQRIARRRAGEPAPSEPRPFARWTFADGGRDQVGSLDGARLGGAGVSRGRLVLDGHGQLLRTAPLDRDLTARTLLAWVRVTSPEQRGGAVMSIEDGRGEVFEALVFGEPSPRRWSLVTSGGGAVEAGAAKEASGPRELVSIAVARAADGTVSFYRNGAPLGEPVRTDGPPRVFRKADARVLIGTRRTGAPSPFFAGEVEEASLYDRALTAGEAAGAYAANVLSAAESELTEALGDEARSERGELAARGAALRRRRGALEDAPAMTYSGVRQEPEPTRRLTRGDVRSPAEVVAPGALTAVATLDSDLGLPPDAPEAARRRRLAEWVADVRNPLPARAAVNRLWQYHFGQGIAGTPNDLGAAGEEPSHPELLDWLAVELGASGWSLKAIHRRLVLTAVYRQDSSPNAAAASVDSENRLLWRSNPRRLEGEAVRDTLLAASGDLNLAMGGPSFRPFEVTNFGTDFYTVVDKDEPDFQRRTVYRMNVNSGKDPFLDALDCPDPATRTPRRRPTVTPLQALSLMNNSFVLRQAERLASRVERESGGDGRRAIELAYLVAFGRPPAPAELEVGAAHAAEHGLASLCWVLFNATELVHVD